MRICYKYKIKVRNFGRKEKSKIFSLKLNERIANKFELDEEINDLIICPFKQDYRLSKNLKN